MTGPLPVAGLTVALIGIAPLLLLEWLQSQGTIGGLQRGWLWGGVGAVVLLIAAIAAWAMRRLLHGADEAASDVWATFVAGAAAWLVLSLVAPVVVLVRNATDEVSGVTDAGAGLYAQWALTVLLVAGASALAAAAAHHYLRLDTAAVGQDQVRSKEA